MAQAGRFVISRDDVGFAGIHVQIRVLNGEAHVRFWSRRITGEHHLVYAAEGRAGTDQQVIIAMCGQHY